MALTRRFLLACLTERALFLPGCKAIEQPAGWPLQPSMSGGNSRVFGAFPPLNVCGTATCSKTIEKPPVRRAHSPSTYLENKDEPDRNELPPISHVQEMGGSSLYGGAYLERQRTTSHSGARSSPCFTRFLLIAIRNRLVNKLVECRALLGGADGSHDRIPYDVAVLVDNVGCREREQI